MNVVKRKLIIWMSTFISLPSASGAKITPSPGDASKFLTATSFYQCDALLPRAKPCEKIFASMADVEAHSKSVHGLSCWMFGEVLFIDNHKNLYIL